MILLADRDIKELKEVMREGIEEGMREIEGALKDLVTDNKVLRKILFLSHGCEFNFLYGDDGELQCNHPECMIDFKRDSAETIRNKLAAHGQKIHYESSFVLRKTLEE